MFPKAKACIVVIALLDAVIQEANRLCGNSVPGRRQRKMGRFCGFYLALQMHFRVIHESLYHQELEMVRETWHNFSAEKVPSAHDKVSYHIGVML